MTKHHMIRVGVTNVRHIELSSTARSTTGGATVASEATSTRTPKVSSGRSTSEAWFGLTVLVKFC